MSAWLTLLLVQGTLGALDTLWYHEHVYALPANAKQTSVELRLHAARDFVYAALFLTLPFVRWCGSFAFVLAALLAIEIAITLTDFAIEDRVRAPFGGVAVGERLMHTVMAIVYGAFLATLTPELIAWSKLASGFAASAELPSSVRVVAVLFGIGVFGSGVRDLCAALGIRLTNAQPAARSNRA